MQESKKEAAPASVATTDQSQERTNNCPDDDYTIINQILPLLNIINAVETDTGIGWCFQVSTVDVVLYHHHMKNDDDSVIDYVVREYHDNNLTKYMAALMKVAKNLQYIAEMRGIKE